MLAKVSFFILLVLGVSLCNPITSDVEAVCKGLGIDEESCECNGSVVSMETAFMIMCEGEAGTEVVTQIISECAENDEKSRTLAPELGKLTDLKVLDVNNCNLVGEVPDISDLDKLTVLDLSGNKLTGELPLLHDDALFTDALKLNDNCFTACKNIDSYGADSEFSNNPLVLLTGDDKCTTVEDVAAFADGNLDNCVGVEGIMEDFEIKEGNIVSKQDITLPVKIWDDAKITHKVKFDYASDVTKQFELVGEAKLIAGEAKLEVTFSDSDLTKFREGAEEKEGEDVPVFNFEIKVYSSEDEKLFKDAVADLGELELEENEKIELTVEHKDKKDYIITGVFSSASQIAFLFAVAVALSVQLFF